jgi:hypothetical protein
MAFDGDIMGYIKPTWGCRPGSKKKKTRELMGPRAPMLK